MNVIISNRYSEMLTNLPIDIIKNVRGEYDADVIVSNFQNFFFNKMILDITAVKNYKDINNIQKLSFGLDMNKVILLLDDSKEVNSPTYLSELVSMGIYNFTRSIDSLVYLIDNPNTYKDVARYHMLGGTPNSNMNVNLEPGSMNSNFLNDSINRVFMGSRVIAIKNLTEHAGATTLTYMLKKQLEGNYKTLAIEVDKNDFMYFNDQDMRSVTTSELDSVIKNPNNTYDIILVDINESPKVASISEVLHLIEPSTIKLNKLIRTDRMVLTKMKNYKLILNKCLLSDKDVKDFEYESRCKVFETIPPLDDKKEKNPILNNLLYKMGFDKQTPTSGAKKPVGKLFGIVKDE